MAEQRKENKKIARLAEVVFLRFQFQVSGVRGVICGFLSQNDSLESAVFLGQLVEEGAIYTQSSSRGSEKCRHFSTSKWLVQPPKNAQLLCRCANPMPRIGPANI
jgi:hypothetical protein